MIRVFQLILAPFRTWNAIADEQRGVALTLLISILPLMAVSGFVDVYGLTHWGEKRGDFGHIAMIPQPLAIKYEVMLLALNLLGMFLGAWMLHSSAASFDFRTTFRLSFKTIAYGFTPIFLARMLDATPAINTWVAWGIGAALTLSVLYHGVALVMKPDQTKGFGMYLFTSIIVIAASGIAHVLAQGTLRGLK